MSMLSIVKKKTPLHFARRPKYNYDVEKALIENGAEIKAIDNLKWTPPQSG